MTSMPHIGLFAEHQPFPDGTGKLPSCEFQNWSKGGRNRTGRHDYPAGDDVFRLGTEYVGSLLVEGKPEIPVDDLYSRQSCREVSGRFDVFHKIERGHDDPPLLSAIGHHGVWEVCHANEIYSVSTPALQEPFSRVNGAVPIQFDSMGRGV